jgi:hypothetical protein
MEVLDKGKAAAVTTIVETRDKLSGKLILENQSTFFVRGAGGFGGKRVGRGMIHPVMFVILRVEGRVAFAPIDRGAASAVNAPPKRAPDASTVEKTSPTQAALYR